jgi:peptidoglycan hydrolase-like protein with peptidoglycan-binding domain
VFEECVNAVVHRWSAACAAPIHAAGMLPRAPTVVLVVVAALLLPASAAASSGGAAPAAVPVVRSAHLGQRTLRRGAHGHDVRVLQDFLTRAGLATPIAGVFGPLTERNVRLFERGAGLRADGIVTRRVAAALRAAAYPPAGGATGAPTVPATLDADGTATAPAGAPPAIQAVIAAGNRIASTPYLWGGGHASWNDTGYDCSGSVSYALHGGGLLDASEDSSGLMSYGAAGPGTWITLYSNPDHVFMVVAGLRYDTSGAKPSRWQADMRSASGYTVRHPAGY